MSGASTATAVKNHVESLGLGLAAYRDGAPTDESDAIIAPYPHVVIQEGIGYAQNSDGDFGDPNADQTMVELVQVDLYQRARVLTQGGAHSQNVESYSLPDELRRKLHGAQLQQIGDRRVYGVSVRDGRRWPIADNVVCHTYTLAINRRT